MENVLRHTLYLFIFQNKIAKIIPRFDTKFLILCCFILPEYCILYMSKYSSVCSFKTMLGFKLAQSLMVVLWSSSPAAQLHKPTNGSYLLCSFVLIHLVHKICFHFHFIEPVGSSVPKFSSVAKTQGLETKSNQSFTLLCPAQGFPVPSYRSV